MAKPQRDINTALACAVFAVLFNAMFWALAFRTRTTMDGARSYFVFGALIGIAMELAAWQLQAKGLLRRPPDRDRGTARIVRIICVFHIPIAVIAGAILLARTA
jgi:hypothetical protein